MKCISLLAVFLLSVTQVTFSETIVRPTMPGTNIPDLMQPALVRDGDVIYESYPGLTTRDYSKEPLNKSVFLLAKSEVGRFFSHRFEKFGFWLMNPRYLLPFWGFPHAADGLLPSCQ